MAPGKPLMRIEPCPMVKNSSLSTIGSNPFGILNLKDMGVGFDPLMCAWVMIPFNIISLGATTR
jgi:hypothetical protein